MKTCTLCCLRTAIEQQTIRELKKKKKLRIKGSLMEATNLLSAVDRQRMIYDDEVRKRDAIR